MFTATVQATRLAFSFLLNLTRLAKTARTDASLLDFTQPLRAEPRISVEESLLGQTFTPLVLQNANITFATCMLQAATTVINLQKVDVLGLMDSLNPNRNTNIASVAKGVYNSFSKEAYENGLPRPTDYQYSPEALNVGRDTMGALTSMPNLAQGITLDLSVNVGENRSVPIPMTVRLNVVPISVASLKDIYQETTKDISFKTRRAQLASGEIDLWNDLCNMTDLADQRTQALMRDTSGTFRAILDQRKKNRNAAIASGRVSLSTASNMYVISQKTFQAIQDELLEDFNDVNVRKRFFEKSYAMILYVVDTQWKRVVIYYRNYDEPSELSIDDLKFSSKGGPNINELLALMNKGTAPFGR